jgi:thiosulfate/3-mercaptopyruvate sulfurtransferase
MKNTIIILFSFLSLLIISCNKSDTGSEPWTQEQLMDPAVLAQMLNNPSAKLPIILDIGPFGGIKNSIRIGQAREKANIEKLKQFLNNQPKDADIVIYCGCCPFDDCPNIRPAFRVLNDMGFTNAKLLNLPRNLKTDWSDKGYPMAR